VNAASIGRRAFIAVAAAALAGAASAQGAAFPTKPIHLIVAFPPGGSTTPVARLVGQKLSERLGQPVVVDNRPGANGVIASEELLRAPADGYTLLMIGNTHSLNPLVMGPMQYDNARDFTPVSTLFRFELVLVGHPSVQAANLGELIALAKAQPGKLNFAVGDNVGQIHLGSETLNAIAGVKIQVVSYKGSAPALNDTLGGHADMAFASPTAVMGFIRTGKLRGYAISGRTRSSVLPEVPTFAESGLQGVDVGGWVGLLARAGTPKAIVDKLATELAVIIAAPDIKESLGAMGLEPSALATDQFANLIKADTAKFEAVIKTANIKIDK
jgi:tripartite-type tricarboxylate transporter receptor subunit TctC